MKLLAIDTSTDKATLALAAGRDILVAEQESARQHAQVLLSMIESLLAEAELKLNQLDGIVFGRGPGSFTGLRIACSISKALAYAHDLPIYPVSGLAAIAAEFYSSKKNIASTPLLAVIDARMQEFYWGLFACGHLEAEEAVNAPAAISFPFSGPIMVAGNGLDIAQLSRSVQAQVIQQVEMFPHAKAMLNIVKTGHVKPVHASDALPIYIRNRVTQGESRG